MSITLPSTYFFKSVVIICLLQRKSTCDISMKRQLAYPIILLGVASSMYVAGLEIMQVATVTIFSSLIAGALLFWRMRLAFALAGIAALMALGLLDTRSLIDFASIDLILFLVGMMIVVGYLEAKGFFSYLLEKITARVGNNPYKLILVLMLMSGLFAALVDEVTSILFMTATVLHLGAKFRVSVIPLVIMTVFATNIGSSATVVGNPVGVLIAFRAGLTFMDFLQWATPISIIALFVTILLCMKYFSKDIRQLGVAMRVQSTEPTNYGENMDRPKQTSYKLTWLLFLGTIVGLVLHSQVEELLGLEKNVMLLGTAFSAASVAVFLEHKRARELVERSVHWWTLSFFIFLFAAVGSLKIMGITKLLTNGIFAISGGDETLLFIFFTVIVGFLSALMDNILAVAAFIPVVEDMASLGVYNYPLWWAMLFAATFFGNLTFIGSTANIIALGMLERERRAEITMKIWLKPGALVSIVTLFLAMLLISLQIPLMPR